MCNNIFRSFLILSVIFAFSIPISLFAQDYDNKSSVGVSYLTNKNSNSYLQLGLQLENSLGSLNKPSDISALYEISFLAGLDNAKDNYMANVDFGLRLSAFRGDYLRLYFDIMTGITLNYMSNPKDNYLGSNAKLIMGLNYNFLSVELSTMYINTEISNVGLTGIGIKINF